MYDIWLKKCYLDSPFPFVGVHVPPTCASSQMFIEQILHKMLVKKSEDIIRHCVIQARGTKIL